MHALSKTLKTKLAWERMILSLNSNYLMFQLLPHVHVITNAVQQ